MILCTENPEDSTKNLLQLINEFSKVTGYKVNIQKSMAFLYINDELSERKIEKTIPYTNTSKRIKYLQKFNQRGERPVHWNRKTLWKKLKMTQINAKKFHAHGMERLILLKRPYYPRPSIDSMQSLNVHSVNGTFHTTQVYNSKICIQPHTHTHK